MLEISELMNSYTPNKPTQKNSWKNEGHCSHVSNTKTVLCLLKPVKCGATAMGETVQLILIGPSHETDGNQSLLSRFARFMSPLNETSPAKKQVR